MDKGNITKKPGLMITLGHNSSALFYDQIGKPIGYEEERLTGKKSDSSFPIKAINEILKNIDAERLRNGTIFISHWFDTFNEDNFPEKYYNKNAITDLCTEYDMKIVHLSKEFTHHDAHAYSSKAFLDSSIESTDKKYHYEDMHYIVADGFGNNKEVISIYSQNNGSECLKLVDRFYGYDHSLGLLYQYATSYCGMKENQDEYKFLGYESEITEITSLATVGLIKQITLEYVNEFLETLKTQTEKPDESDIYLDFEDLKRTKTSFHNLFDTVMKAVPIFDEVLMDQEQVRRIVIGHFIQSCVERIMSRIIIDYKIQNVCLSGGCFYNVKLNNSILKNTTGFVSVMPLAGDQGAAIGMYKAVLGDFDFHDLCYGKREISRENITLSMDERIIFFDDDQEMVDVAVELLNNDNVVNIIHGDMEFGPRALCNTSTLALPTQDNVDYINYINDRNSVMPMAPVVLDRNVKYLFDNDVLLDRVIGSNNYMIMTHDYCQNKMDLLGYEGVMHMYPDRSGYSGRPQIVCDSSAPNKPITKILGKTNSHCLINTSFNTHGTPILFSTWNAIDDFRKQCLKDRNQSNFLLILKNV